MTNGVCGCRFGWWPPMGEAFWWGVSGDRLMAPQPSGERKSCWFPSAGGEEDKAAPSADGREDTGGFCAERFRTVDSSSPLLSSSLLLCCVGLRPLLVVGPGMPPVGWPECSRMTIGVGWWDTSTLRTTLVPSSVSSQLNRILLTSLLETTPFPLRGDETGSSAKLVAQLHAHVQQQTNGSRSTTRGELVVALTRPLVESFFPEPRGGNTISPW